MTELGAAQAPPSDEELLATLGPTIKSLVENEIEADSDPEKVWQYNNARRNYLMFRGLQFLAPTMQGGYSDYAPVGNGFSTSGQGSDEGCFDYTRNIFRGLGNKFIAVLGQRAPNVIAQSDDPGDEKSTQASRSANDCNEALNSWWNVDERNIEVTRILWTTGPAYIYTPWNANGLLYGYREEPRQEIQQQPMGPPEYRCMNCGTMAPQPGTCPKCAAPITDADQQPQQMVDVPVTTGTDKYPNGRVECNIVDCTMVTTPFYTKNDLRFCPWLSFKYEENLAVLISIYGEALRAKMADSDSSSEDDSQGRFTRDAIISPSGTPIRSSNKARRTYSRTWIQASQYELIKDESMRKMAQENFPSGMKITRVQGDVIKIEEERLDEVWASVQPSASETLNADPVGQDLISAQQLVNHMLNITAETFERTIPMTLVDPRVWNMQAWNKQKSRPGTLVPALAAVGSTLGESFVDLPAGRVSDQVGPWISSVEQGSAQDVGVVPTIFGGGNAGTAREAEINKNAAMMQLGIPWMYIRKGWERAKRNGVLQLVKYGPATIREGKMMVELSALTGGAWHFVADEAIPQSWGQQRDLWMFMMEKPPQVLEALGYTNPANLPKIAGWLGLSNWDLPGIDDRDKTLDTIQKLLQGQSIQKPNPDGSMETQPSIPPDQFEDDPALVVNLVRDWAQSRDGRNEREMNPGGYANVIAWGIAYQKLANPPAAPPPPPQPKLSLSADLAKLPPAQADALLADFKLQVPPTPPPSPDTLPHVQSADLVSKVAQHQLRVPSPRPKFPADWRTPKVGQIPPQSVQ
jgi:hypothetical protein